MLRSSNYLFIDYENCTEGGRYNVSTIIKKMKTWNNNITIAMHRDAHWPALTLEINLLTGTHSGPIVHFELV